jgi:hypothetical protein
MQQQSLMHNSSRYAAAVAPAKVLAQGLVGQHGAMMAGRMMAGGMGVVTGQSLSNGLEDLKKTAGVCACRGQRARTAS